MDYPLSKDEIKRIEECLKTLCNDWRKCLYEIPVKDYFTLEFLRNKGFIRITTSAGYPTQTFEEANRIYLSASEEAIMHEINSINQKVKDVDKKEWRIGISSAVIGGLLGVIGTLISTALIG